VAGLATAVLKLLDRVLLVAVVIGEVHCLRPIPFQNQMTTSDLLT